MKDDKKGGEVDHNGHRQRLISRFLSEGLKSFEPHNVIELILFFAIPRADTNDTAHRLITRFKTVSGVLNADYKALTSIEGVGKKSALLLRVIGQLISYTSNEQINSKAPILNSEDAIEFFKPKFAGVKVEQFYLLTMNKNGSIISCVMVSEGGFTYTDANIRKIIEEAIYDSASAAIIAHNHPHGVAVPSASDVDTTRQISEMLAKIDVNLTDHIIISQEDSFAMARIAKFSGIFSICNTKRVASEQPQYNI